MADTKCPDCEGCGQVASGSGEPWTAWAALPLQSASAVILGLVKPVPCSSCLGLGDAEAADAVRLLRRKGYSADEVVAVMKGGPDA